MKKRDKPVITRIPMCKVSPNSVVLYDDLDGYTRKGNSKIYVDTEHYYTPANNTANLRNNKHSGFLSKKSVSRLRAAIKYLFWLSGVFTIKNDKIISHAYKRVSMLTLTLSSPQVHNDNYIKSKMLNQFFIELRKFNSNLIYLWRAERQKNGNLHFHVLINIYLPLNLLLSTWNRIQAKEGYLQPYTEKHKYLSFIDYCLLYPPRKFSDYNARRKAYINQKSTGWANPNSLDIQSLKNVKNSYSYCSKYVSKCEYTEIQEKYSNNEISEKEYKDFVSANAIQGHIWYASESILNISSIPEMISSSLDAEISQLHEIKDIFIKEFTYLKVICISAERLFNLGFFHLFNLFRRQLPTDNILLTLNL
jgi:hypothetical protein